MNGDRSAGFPRVARLLRRAEFEAALATKPVLIRRHFSVFARPNDGGAARIGIVVGRKVAPRAVDRNRIKRFLREGFRRNRARLGASDLVMLARRCPERGQWAALRSEIDSLYTQLARRADFQG